MEVIEEFPVMSEEQPLRQCRGPGNIVVSSDCARNSPGPVSFEPILLFTQNFDIKQKYTRLFREI